MYHDPQKQQERPLPNVPVSWSHILSQARLRTLCTSVTVPIFPKPKSLSSHEPSFCILQHWVKNIPHKLYWEKQTWSSLGWGNWLHYFHFPCECCRHFLLNSRQAAVTTVTSATIKLSEDPVPGGMGTQVQRPIYGLQENRGHLCRPLSEMWCQPMLFAQTLEPNIGVWWVWAACRNTLWLESFEGIHWICGDSLLSQSLFRSQWSLPQLAWQD